MLYTRNLYTIVSQVYFKKNLWMEQRLNNSTYKYIALKNIKSFWSGFGNSFLHLIKSIIHKEKHWLKIVSYNKM